MARGENFYVYEWFNREIDEHPHYGIMSLDAAAKPKKYFEQLKVHNSKLELNTDQDLSKNTFDSKDKAEARAKELGDLADQAYPDRVGLDKQFPEGEANRALSVGRQGPTPKAGENMLAEGP